MAAASQSLETRRKYVMAFNRTMVDIWKEKLIMMKAVDTGALYSSVVSLPVKADGTFTEIELSQSFNEYGLYVDAGTGRETYAGNSGDIGRAKLREAKPWFSRKYYASVRNIQEFMADSLGRECALAVSDALSGRSR